MNFYKVLTLIISIIIIAINVFAFLWIPQYKEIHDSFGADLPVPTRLLINNYKYLLPSIILIPIILYFNCLKNKRVTNTYHHHHQWYVLGYLLFIVTLIFIFLFIIWAVYLPVFNTVTDVVRAFDLIDGHC